MQHDHGKNVVVYHGKQYKLYLKHSSFAKLAHYYAQYFLVCI